MTAPDPRLDEIEARLSAATPGPWKADTATRGDCVVWGPDGRFLMNAQAEPHWVEYPGEKRAVSFDVDKRDCEFIAHAPADVAYLLAELRKAHAKMRAAQSVAWDIGFEACEQWDIACSRRPEWVDGHPDKPSNPYRAAVAAANGDGERAASQSKVIPIPRSAVTNLYRTRKMTAKAMTIPDEAVEAAAKALAWRGRSHFPAADECWAFLTEDGRAQWIGEARAALEAAAPYIRAQALEDAAEAIDSDDENCLYSSRRRELAYPYSKPMLAEQWGELDGIERAAQFIRARAVAERGGA